MTEGAQGAMDKIISQEYVSDHQFERMEKFVQYDRPPGENDAVDMMVVLGTSKIVDRPSYDQRIHTILKLAKRYPEAEFVVSGKRPDVSRASEEEMKSDYSEAAVMAGDMIENGVEQSRIILEEEAVHTMDNVLKSLALLQKKGKDPKNLLFVTGSYQGRRTDYYIPKIFEQLGIDPATHKTYIIDAEMDAIREGREPNPERNRYMVTYESARLSRYRKKGDL